MLIGLVSALLLTSPYPFEIKAGFIAEPTLGFQLNDKTDTEKALAGLRISYVQPDQADAFITSEIQILSATSFDKISNASGQREMNFNTDYYFETGFVFYEIYNPFAFRLALGGGVEARKTAHADLYYRGGLGYYFNQSFGVFMDLEGRIIFRTDEKTSMPFNIGPSFQFIF